MKVIISGGGTGGHIFPAISIANELKRQVPDVDILFVGAIGRMEMERIPAAGYKIVGLPVKGLQRKLTLKNIQTLVNLIVSLRKSKKLVREFQPDFAVGVGGYASGPMLYAASKAGVPCLVQEQNSYAGITNKILSKQAQKICVAYDKMEQFFPVSKIVKTGNPVRQEIVEMSVTKDDGVAEFNLNPQLKTLLVVGGSLGARTINQSMAKSLNKLNQHNVQVIWQTGKLYYEEAKKQSQGYKNIRVMDFISRMDLAFAAADVIISRAGAGTISELCIVGKPCVFVPSPNVSEDHQTKNAMALVEKDAALMVKDSVAKDELVPMVMELIKDEDKMNSLAINIKKLEIKNSAELIVNELLKMRK